MLKTTLIALGFSTVAAGATFVFVGRTVHSSSFQMDIPYGSSIKVTPDPANIWSWHHTFPMGNETAEVLVDVDGNNVMDTEHAWLRVMITDLQIIHNSSNACLAWIRDSTGRRFGVATGGWQAGGPMAHEALATPIVLPVGSSLFVECQAQPGTEVHLIGRVVNL